MTEFNPASVQIVYSDALKLLEGSATGMQYDHETVSGWFDYMCDETTPCVTTARFDGSRRKCLKRCHPGRHQVCPPRLPSCLPVALFSLV
eukprot:SAG31_NODE_17_length_35773_cov_25.999271_37_plen_90_part_00